MSNSYLFTAVLLRTHSIVFFAVHETRRIFLSPFISKVSRHVPSFFLRVQLPQPYVATGYTSTFITHIFVEIGMLWLFHIFCSDAPIACLLFNLVTEFWRTLTIFCNKWLKVWERLGTYPPAPVVHSEWVCGTLCRRSPLPWSCRHWWVICICGWLSLGNPRTPVVLPPKVANRMMSSASRRFVPIRPLNLDYLILNLDTTDSTWLKRGVGIGGDRSVHETNEVVLYVVMLNRCGHSGVFTCVRRCSLSCGS